MRRILVLLALAGLLAGCGGPVGALLGPDVVSVGYDAGTASVEAGEHLRVDLGAYNSSIGDGWFLTGAPDAAVLADLGQDYDSDGCPRDVAGCGGTTAWLFRATGPGTATIVLRYCYRSRADACEPQPDRGPAEPVTLTVTVT